VVFFLEDQLRLIRDVVGATAVPLIPVHVESPHTRGMEGSTADWRNFGDSVYPVPMVNEASNVRLAATLFSELPSYFKLLGTHRGSFAIPAADEHRARLALIIKDDKSGSVLDIVIRSPEWPHWTSTARHLELIASYEITVVRDRSLRHVDDYFAQLPVVKN